MISCLTFLIAAVSPMDTGSIASNSASYDGSMLVLDGEVSLEHGFGMMKAEKAVLTRPLQTQEEFPFTSIELARSVRLSLTTKAEVECERASLDFVGREAKLTSPKNVHYIDTARSFELLAPELYLQIQKESYDLERAHAHKGVHLIYDTSYHLKTESIVFAQDLISSDKSGCTWTYQNDQVKGEKFVLDLARNHLHLTDARGHVSSLSKGEVNFTAETLDWQHTANHLLLKGSPKVQESNMGTITSHHTIDLTLKDHQLHRLKTEGPTELVSLKGHSLKTEGIIDLDTEKSLLVVHPGTQQLLYKEEELSLMADTAQLQYKEGEQELELKGHIKIFSKSHRGIADILTYHPETRMCILKALPGQKVLFMRDQDLLRISANEIHITYDPVSKEQQVRGVGHITLSFSPEEQNLLNQVFSP